MDRSFSEWQPLDAAYRHNDSKYNFSRCYCKMLMCQYVDSLACSLRINSCQEANIERVCPLGAVSRLYIYTDFILEILQRIA